MTVIPLSLGDAARACTPLSIEEHASLLEHPPVSATLYPFNAAAEHKSILRDEIGEEVYEAFKTLVSARQSRYTDIQDQYDALCRRTDFMARQERAKYHFMCGDDADVSMLLSGSPISVAHKHIPTAIGDAYAIASSPAVVWCAYAMSLANLDKLFFHSADKLDLLVFSPSLVSSSAECQAAERTLHSSIRCVFDERKYPDLFSVDMSGACPKTILKHGYLPAYIYAPIINKMCHDTISSLFEDTNCEHSLLSMLALPEDPPETRSALRAMSRMHNRHIRDVVFTENSVPSFVRALSVRAQVLPLVGAQMLIERNISAGASRISAQEEVCARLDCYNNFDDVYQELNKLYYDEDISSVLDALGAGVPIEDIFA